MRGRGKGPGPAKGPGCPPLPLPLPPTPALCSMMKPRNGLKAIKAVEPSPNLTMVVQKVSVYSQA